MLLSLPFGSIFSQDLTSSLTYLLTFDSIWVVNRELDSVHAVTGHLIEICPLRPQAGAIS